MLGLFKLFFELLNLFVSNFNVDLVFLLFPAPLLWLPLRLLDPILLLVRPSLPPDLFFLGGLFIGLENLLLQHWGPIVAQSFG